MSRNPPFALESLDASAFIAIIHMQTEIARCGMDLGQVLTLVCEHVTKLTRCSSATIEMADGEQIINRASAGNLASLLGQRLAIDGSLAGLCVKTGRVMVCNDALTDPRVDQVFCRVAGIRSMVIVPLTHHSNPVGVLRIVSEHAQFFTSREVAILELVSGLVAAAMYHSARFSVDQLYHRATHDALTNLPNRSFFFERLRFVLAHAGRNNGKFALLNIDMDGLKKINDRLGHRCGDAAIQELGNRVSRSIRDSDFVARLGGDEFAVILSNVDNVTSVERKLRTIQERITQRFRFEHATVPLRASIGYALYPDHGTTVRALIDRADSTMYVQKHQRKKAVYG